MLHGLNNRSIGIKKNFCTPPTNKGVFKICFHVIFRWIFFPQKDPISKSSTMKTLWFGVIFARKEELCRKSIELKFVSFCWKKKIGDKIVFLQNFDIMQNLFLFCKNEFIPLSLEIHSKMLRVLIWRHRYLNHVNVDFE